MQPLVYMKSKLSSISIILVTYFLLFPKNASAHLFGQPPFFKINNEYSNFYHVPLTSLYDFGLPQDAAPKNYLVGEQISFGFDENRLPAPPDVVEKTKFIWDFGDGESGSRLSNTHTYKKMGSYIITIYADDGTTPTPQLLESVLVNILPDQNYPLPKAVITVDGIQSKDPLTDILHFPLTNSLQYSASESKDEKTSITSYTWDFGDQKSSDKKVNSHSYSKDTQEVFVVLRIKDSNNFIADDFVEIKNGPADPSRVPSSKPIASSRLSNTSSPALPLLLTFAFLLLTFFTVRLFARSRGRGTHQ